MQHFDVTSIVIAVVGGLLGLVIKGLSGKIFDLASEIKALHLDMKELVSKEVCAAHREKLEGDINNLGELVRNK